MEYSFSLSSLSFPTTSPSMQRKQIFPRKSRLPTKIAASKYGAYNHDYDGKLVDENMIVLRERIREMKKTDSDYVAPSNWTEWERKYYMDSYDSDVCEALGLLQSWLMETRPSLALGAVALIALSVPTSMVVVLLHLIQIFRGLL